MATKKSQSTIQKRSADTMLVMKPRITEKATMLAERNVYTFNVGLRSNATEIKKAIELLYDVTPVKVSILKVMEKRVFVRGKKGVKKGGKKAVVYLKKGDTISFS